MDEKYVEFYMTWRIQLFFIVQWSFVNEILSFRSVNLNFNDLDYVVNLEVRK